MNNERKRVCQSCGYEYEVEKNKWFGKCPNCGTTEPMETAIDLETANIIIEEDDGYCD